MQCANVCVLLQGEETAELEGIRGPLAQANDDHGGPGVGLMRRKTFLFPREETQKKSEA